VKKLNIHPLIYYSLDFLIKILKYNNMTNYLHYFNLGGKRAINICKFIKEDANIKKDTETCIKCSEAIDSLINYRSNRYIKFKDCVMTSSKYKNEKDIANAIIENNRCDYFTKNICENLVDDPKNAQKFYDCMMLGYYIS
jgi:hypothetical protein